jgi:hypothetical protein
MPWENIYNIDEKQGCQRALHVNPSCLVDVQMGHIFSRDSFLWEEL